MYKPSWFRIKTLLEYKLQAKRISRVAKSSNILFFAIGLIVFAVMISLWDSQTTYYAHASVVGLAKESQLNSPLFEDEQEIFDGKNKSAKSGRQSVFQKNKSHKFAEKLYLMVGETPIKEMVPFISERDEKVAAFLVGIAKKESSFGLASPSKDGETCYNYWGYKGEGGRGTGMGYACFASAEEAISVVGNRIEVLIGKERNTPARMVDTWKCGKSCAGDPGAPGWTSTVALYFNQIVDQNI